MNASRPPFAAALMAGGRSSRMGTDKAFLTWHGEALWCHQWRKLESLDPSEMFMSGRTEQGFPADKTLVTDRWPDCGPLGGLASVLRVCRRPRLLVLAVDLPVLPAAALGQLLDVAGESRGAVFRHANGTFEPLAAVYPVRLWQDARTRVESGQLALHEFVSAGVRTGDIVPVAVPMVENWFQNVNSPDEWQAATNFKT